MSLKKNDFKANPTHPSIQVTLGRPSQLRGPMELRTHLQGVKVVSTYTASCQPTGGQSKANFNVELKCATQHKICHARKRSIHLVCKYFFTVHSMSTTALASGDTVVNKAEKNKILVQMNLLHCQVQGPKAKHTQDLT